MWEADRIILTGEIIYHLIAGYSGGRKSLVPGVAGFRTTTFNHRHDLRSALPGGKTGRQSRARRPAGGLPHGGAGLHRERGAESGGQADPRGGGTLRAGAPGRMPHRGPHVARARLQRRTTWSIASAGGFPLDIDLRQAHKGLENACQALRPGGVDSVLCRVPERRGHPVIRRVRRRYRDDFEMREALLREFVVGGHKAYWVARLGRMYDVHLVSETGSRNSCGAAISQPVSPAEHEAVLAKNCAAGGPDARVAVIALCRLHAAGGRTFHRRS